MLDHVTSLIVIAQSERLRREHNLETNTATTSPGSPLGVIVGVGSSRVDTVYMLLFL